ncbi:P-loop containing nucleoside triphosphate hydrolase protein [Biscogniauxia sp. FL1348]|nr:P-loop containing nucleoside triphosphate hydrolase protein [Biscogniauxia sp. FL1348]
MRISNMGNNTTEERSSGNLAILTKVDRLRGLVSNSVALPQVLVVGDQSSGKSSVLEGLTGFAFPRDAELCTRYATQITCRRENEESITVSIIPSHDASSTERQKVQGFHRTLTKMSPETLDQLFRDANTAMGIRTSTSITSRSDPNQSAFSQHILKIEKLGPSEDHFTVIDVPGIFRKETEGITTENDITLVRNMVEGYMTDERTIILAIMPSNVDPATQEILKLAKKADPKMTRTMAVLTKPDLTIERTTQQIAIDHVLDKRNYLTLGYYIVKNRGPDDVDKSLAQGQADEQVFFSKAPWSILKHTGKTGIESLKVRVRELLIDLIKKEFPQLKRDVAKKLATARTERDKMGPSRSNQHTQRAYLNKISEKFQSLVRDAIEPDYTASKLLTDHLDLRLVTRIVELSDKYVEEMTKNGHMRAFISDNHRENGSPSKGQFVDTDSEEEDIYLPSSPLLDEYPELEEILDPTDTILPDPSGPVDIIDYIEEVYKGSRGQELGTFGSRLLGTVFKEQSKKWEPITLWYINQAIICVHHFIYVAIKDVCPDPKVQDVLWDEFLLEQLQASYRKAVEHAKFLLEIERETRPYTLNHYFNDNLQKYETERLSSSLKASGEKIALPGPHGSTKEGIFISNLEMLNLSVDKTNSEYIRERMHDVLKSYYKVSLKRFVDVVCMQVINHGLLSGKPSPLKIFNSEMVLNLSEEQLEMIAGEDVPVKTRRDKLEREIENYEAALKVLRGSG